MVFLHKFILLNKYINKIKRIDKNNNKYDLKSLIKNEYWELPYV
jgi:hypothetical protein